MMKIEITKGWNGDTVESLGETGDRAKAYAMVREWAKAHPGCGPLREVWTYSFTDEWEVVDYGSHTHFGRILGEARQ